LLRIEQKVRKSKWFVLMFLLAPSFNEVVNNKYIKEVIFQDEEYHVLMEHLPEG